MTADAITPAEEEFAFYFLIGRTLSQWAHVEGQLQRVVAGAVSADDGAGVAAGYLAIETFRLKLAFADKLLRRKYLHSGHIPGWELLARRLERGATLRDRIAQGRLVMHPEGDAGRRYGLVRWNGPKEQRSQATVAAPADALCLLDLEIARAEFHGLMTALSNFRETLAGRPMPFQTALAQPTGQRSLQPLLDQLRAAFAGAAAGGDADG